MKYYLKGLFFLSAFICFSGFVQIAFAGGPLVIVVHGVGGGNRQTGWSEETRNAYQVPASNWIEVNFNLPGRDEEMISTIDFAHHAGSWASQVQNGIISAIKAHPNQKIMIIAHSWGTVATSLALNGGITPEMELQHIQLEGRKISRWITLGSPLGRADNTSVAPNLRQLNVHVLADKPSDVEAWTNIYDVDDPVSMQSHNLPADSNISVSRSGALEWIKRSVSFGVSAHTAIWLQPEVVDIVRKYYKDLEQPDTGSIAVSVIRKKDKSGIGNARITAMLAGGANSAATSDNEGKALLESITAGSYTLEAVPPAESGLISGRSTLQLKENENLNVTIMLDEEKLLTDDDLDAAIRVLRQQLDSLKTRIGTLQAIVPVTENHIASLNKPLEELVKLGDILVDTPDEKEAVRLIDELENMCRDVISVAQAGSSSINGLGSLEQAVDFSGQIADKNLIASSDFSKCRKVFEKISLSLKFDENLSRFNTQADTLEKNIASEQSALKEWNDNVVPLKSEIQKVKSEYQRLSGLVKKPESRNSLAELASDVADLKLPAFNTDVQADIEKLESTVKLTRAQINVLGPSIQAGQKPSENLVKIVEKASNLYQASSASVQKLADDCRAYLAGNRKILDGNEQDIQKLIDALKEAKKTDTKLKNQIEKRQKLIDGGASESDATRWRGEIDNMKVLLAKNDKSRQEAKQAAKSMKKENDMIKQIDSVLSPKLSELEKCLNL